MPVHPNSLANLRPVHFKKGVPANPGGRPKGALTSLSGKFIKDFAKHYEEHGMEAINALCAENPGKYVELAAKLALSVVPKDVNINNTGNVLDDLTREQLADLDRNLRTVIGLAGPGIIEIEQAADEGELSPVH